MLAGNAGGKAQGRVKDLGRVELGSKQSDYVSRLNGGVTAAMAIYLAPGANAVAVADGVKAAMDRLAERFPDDMDYASTYDTTDFVKASLEKVINTLLEAFVLVIIVVFLFLGSWRATLIPLIAVPVALVGTFAFLLMIGFSANPISLLAVVLAIGIVVDDAIVIMGAVMGCIDRVRDGYAYLVARLVRVVLLVLVAVAGAGFATGWLFQVTPTGFLPEEDQGAFMAEVQLPQGASVNRTLDVVKQVEEIVGADPAIEHVLTVPGYSILDRQCSVQQRYGLDSCPDGA